MEADLAKISVSRIISITFYDRNTDKVLYHLDNPKYIKSEE